MEEQQSNILELTFQRKHVILVNKSIHIICGVHHCDYLMQTFQVQLIPRDYFNMTIE